MNIFIIYNYMNLYYLAIIILVLFLCFNIKEGLSYEDKRKYFYCKYRLDPNSPKCQNVFENIREKNQPTLVGIIYSDREDSDKTYNLYKKENSNNNYDYYIKIPKKNDYILKKIYSSPYELYDNQKINISNHNFNPFIVQIYENSNTNCRSCKINPAGKHHICKNCWNSIGTRYDESLIPWRNVGYIHKINGKRDKFYNLYEKSLDSSRNNYRYYINDAKQEVKIPLNEKELLQHGLTINIDGKKGQYRVYRYDMDHPSYTF